MKKRTKETKAVTERFMSAMFDIIKEQKLKNGKIDTVKAFAESLGQSAQNFSKLGTHGQHVSMPIVEAAWKRGSRGWKGGNKKA